MKKIKRFPIQDLVQLALIKGNLKHKMAYKFFKFLIFKNYDFFRHEKIYHNYYMWVPYLLLIQSVTFFVPLLLHRFCQEGKAQLLLQGLHQLTAFNETREDKYGDAKLYFRDWYNHHDWWAGKLFFCDMLNLVNIVFNILLTNW
jgi:hypothetical protein